MSIFTQIRCVSCDPIFGTILYRFRAVIGPILDQIFDQILVLGFLDLTFSNSLFFRKRGAPIYTNFELIIDLNSEPIFGEAFSIFKSIFWPHIGFWSNLCAPGIYILLTRASAEAFAQTLYSRRIIFNQTYINWTDSQTAISIFTVGYFIFWSNMWNVFHLRISWIRTEHWGPYHTTISPNQDRRNKKIKAFSMQDILRIEKFFWKYLRNLDMVFIRFRVFVVHIKCGGVVYFWHDS